MAKKSYAAADSLCVFGRTGRSVPSNGMEGVSSFLFRDECFHGKCGRQHFCFVLSFYEDEAVSQGGRDVKPI